MTSERCLPTLLGVHVLGLSAPDERAALRRHLARCASCRAEFLRLRDVVTVLAAAAPALAPRAEVARATEAAAGVVG